MGQQKMEKKEKLIAAIRDCGNVAVAFSGGVDSAVLAKAAVLALGETAVAVTADSELLPREELADAKRLAAMIGIRHVVLPTLDLANPQLIANGKERCYYCKKEKFTKLIEWAKMQGIQCVLEGSNADDCKDYRPGMRALQEKPEVSSPLLQVGFSKQEIRALAKDWRLPVWDKPSAACLASRISYGLEITAQRLQQVECAEQVVCRYTQGQVRVRHHGDLARIEVSNSAELMQIETRRQIVGELKNLGFIFVVLDMEDYRKGSTNASVFIS